MSANLSTVQQIYASFGQGDVPGILEKLDENVRWEDWADNSAQKAGIPWMQLQLGKAGVLSFFQYLGSKFKISDFQVLSMMDGGDKIAVEFVIEAELLASGKRYRDEEIHLWTFDGAGKVVGLRHYLDTHKHIEVSQ